MKFKILPSIVTTSHFGKKVATWDQLEEVKRLGLKEIGLFPTTFDLDKRQRLYGELEKIKDLKIPFLHLRDDFTLEEMEYLMGKFGTEVFNCHHSGYLPLRNDLTKYKNIIYLEIMPHIDITSEIDNWAGVCLDTAHLENTFLQGSDIYNKSIKLLEKYKCGCWHVGPITKEPIWVEKEGRYFYDWHYFEELPQFDYIRKYKKYLAAICAMEVENTIQKQQEAIVYIEKLLV